MTNVATRKNNKAIGEWKYGGLIISEFDNGDMWWESHAGAGRCWLNDDGSLEIGSMKVIGAACHDTGDNEKLHKEAVQDAINHEVRLPQLPEWENRPKEKPENMPDWLCHLIGIAIHGNGFLTMKSCGNEHLLLDVCKWYDTTPVHIGFEYVGHDGNSVATGEILLDGSIKGLRGVDVYLAPSVLRGINNLLESQPDVLRTFKDDESAKCLDGETIIHDVMDTTFKEPNLDEDLPF